MNCQDGINKYVHREKLSMHLQRNIHHVIGGLLETENSKNKEEINNFFFFEYK